MKKLALTAAVALALAASAFAGSYRVSYSLNGLNKRIVVQAESTQQARNTVKDLFPNAIVTSAHRIKKSY